ncbi:hypothetical protein ACO0K9_24320 [Undibacterium sp. Ji50W]|uniref:hypothetical protein n=1 Tax=Undibacterium sp. Ji50W TaxID=3413041 RepID=UPI003BF24E40
MGQGYTHCFFDCQQFDTNVFGSMSMALDVFPLTWWTVTIENRVPSACATTMAALQMLAIVHYRSALRLALIAGQASFTSVSKLQSTDRRRGIYLLK